MAPRLPKKRTHSRVNSFAVHIDSGEDCWIACGKQPGAPMLGESHQCSSGSAVTSCQRRIVGRKKRGCPFYSDSSQWQTLNHSPHLPEMLRDSATLADHGITWDRRTTSISQFWALGEYPHGLSHHHLGEAVVSRCFKPRFKPIPPERASHTGGAI